MGASVERFPFGQPVNKVVQTDCTPKQVFILGVYASAVHARWTDKNGKTLVKALAVASEPEIFWTGKDAESIIQKIIVPEGLGQLVNAGKQFNGPSGKALDDSFINPLGLAREDTWLCDLAPQSYMNPAQAKAIKEKYTPLVEIDSRLLPANIPVVPPQLANEARRKEILKEIEDSQAGTLMLLGDMPIKWFLSAFYPQHRNLNGFGTQPGDYGRKHSIKLNNREMNVIPLAHPRQVAKLGMSSPKWHDAHQSWLKTARHLL